MPLKKKSRGLRRLSIAFLCALPLALLCAAALYCGQQQVQRRHAELLRLDLPTLVHTNAWLFACALLLLAAGLYVCAIFWYWCSRCVVQPANAARQALAECEALSRTMLATVPCALCALSRANGRLVFSNALALQWLGAGAGQALPDTPDARRLLQQALVATEPGNIEAFNAHDGRSLAVAYAPTQYRRQDVVLCAFADTSARAEMEHLLGLAKAQADKVHESGAGILSNITREIRAPLYGLLGTLEVLGMTALDAEQRQHVGRIQNASLVLEQLIGDLLDIARIESGQFAREAGAFDPRELVESTLAAHAPMAEQKGLIIYGCLDTAVPDCVHGDAGRIRQILSNLLSNAIKFTDSGHVVARLRAQAMPDARVRLDLQIADSGIGISPSEQAMLFKPFHQAGAGPRAERGAGLGLGLFLCARLAAFMGTRIQVISEPGLGSSFSVSFVLEQADEPSGAAPQLQGLHVLVRCARKEAGESVAQWLRHWGAQSRTVPAGIVATGDGDGMLIDLALDKNAEHAPWKGPRIVAGTAGSGGSAALVDRHSARQIGYAVQNLMRGESGPGPDTLSPIHGLLNLRILVVEGNLINRATLHDQLMRLGCHITLAADGAEGLALWNIRPFDLVMTDADMPGMSGYALARALRAQGAIAPIIALVMSATHAEEQRCEAAGMNGWLAKPIGLRALRQRLQAYAAAPRKPEIPAATPRIATESPRTGTPGVPAKYKAIFLETMDKDLVRLETAMKNGDSTDVRALLHRIRGGLAAVHMAPLLNLADDLAALLRKEGVGGTMPQQLAALIAQLRGKMREIAKESNG
ncbi:His Kinase A phosphoacceptor domain protein 3 [Achromobacter xylosoxidans A8]|uniref:histidine kinase n=1 Tax=Achromobacter xylosoxidans (strain A8) TaxID=762376 RepID=E3HJR4_ACHXA|nr:hybrid sensor histidine kinase/response regulator [Achromobacter xylosoxidans]ADP14389.1 His Kinase A phosphoacceptor domain protein 3 [Achromobacter xylosoxidans A8]